MRRQSPVELKRRLPFFLILTQPSFNLAIDKRLDDLGPARYAMKFNERIKHLNGGGVQIYLNQLQTGTLAPLSGSPRPWLFVSFTHGVSVCGYSEIVNMLNSGFKIS